MAFLKGSRYRSLTQSSNVTASGESLLGVDVRIIPVVRGQFLHTVADRDRLDLLSFKYYGTANRWWLIADANRGDFEYPVDFLDPRPFVDHELSVTHPTFLARTESLFATLNALGTAQLGTLGPGGVPVADPFSTVVIVQYAEVATRAAILAAIQSAGFQLLTTSAWMRPAARNAEAFTFTDQRVTQDWNDLIAQLGALPGVRRADSIVAGRRLRVTYNTALIRFRPAPESAVQVPTCSGPDDGIAIAAQIEAKGFAVVLEESRQFDPIGSRIVIPPNQAT